MACLWLKSSKQAQASDSGHLFPHQGCCWYAPESEGHPQQSLDFYVLEQRLEPGTQRPWGEMETDNQDNTSGTSDRQSAEGQDIVTPLGHLHRADHIHFPCAGFVLFVCLWGFVIVLFCLSMLCPCM